MRDGEAAGSEGASAGAGRLAAAAGIAAAVGTELERQLAQPPMPGLHLVATPIGNLGDMTLRAIATLAGADLILCEDTRVSRTLLERFAIRAPLRALHDHNEESETPRILTALAEGRAIALISDAGMPLVSDPGYKLVRAVAAAGHAVTVVPGASAPIAGLALSGLPTDTFIFAGFLPPRQAARRSRLADLAGVPATIVLLETAPRLADALGDIAEVLGAREMVVAREITKRFEEVRRGVAADLAAAVRETPVRGEIVLVIAPPAAREIDDAAIEDALGEALTRLSLRDAAKAVAEDLGVARTRVYALGLTMKDAAS